MDPLGYADRVCCGNWCTPWGATEEQRKYWPARHSDYRDSAPEQLQTIYRLYQPVVQRGRWTMGLLEMWFWKSKPVKHSTHVPCFDSFKWNPLLWRGLCFGRTVEECFWTGTRKMRWTRAVYAAGLGREYVMPVKDIGKHGYKSDIKALFMMYCLMGFIFSCGIGQLFTLCGSCLCINFAAPYSCHARERLRRRYDLPPTFCLPPGIDDCLTHFFCLYCAAHQELRELAVRGVDGPGMHILDVLPRSFAGAPGIEPVLAERRKILEGMLARPPKLYRARGRPQLRRAHGTLALAVADEAAELAAGGLEGYLPMALQYATDDDGASVAPSQASSGSDGPLGWSRYCPPEPQEMMRAGGGGDAVTAAAAAAAAAAGSGRDPQLFRHATIHHIPVIVEEGPGEGPGPVRRAWSVAY